MTTQSVAPFTGAWIETVGKGDLDANKTVAPFTGAWIETGLIPASVLQEKSRTLHGCVD